jgi:hypothetical protein
MGKSEPGSFASIERCLDQCTRLRVNEEPEMNLRRSILALLREEGFRINPAIEVALDDFLDLVESEGELHDDDDGVSSVEEEEEER